MDNQRGFPIYREIKGYRELSAEEIEMMNVIKEYGASLGRIVEQLADAPEVDPRWVAIGKTDLQKGLMALTRAIAKPEFF